MEKSGKTKGAPGYKELKAELREGRFHSLYVLYGEEDFLIGKLVESLEEMLIEPGSAALDKVVFNVGGQPAKLNPDLLEAELMTPPFLSRRKLVIVKNSGWLSPSGARQKTEESDDERSDDEETAVPASSAKNRQEILAGLIRRLPDSVCLIMIENKVDKRLKQLVGLISQKGVLAEINHEQPRILQQWVTAECKRRKILIEPAAAESLIDRCELSMQVIWQELGKLFLYCDHAGCQTVNIDLISEISLPDLRGNIFSLTDALSDGQTERALILVDTLISQRQPIQLIQFMLARHLRQLICAAELGSQDRIVAQLKVMPFVAGRLARQAKRLSIPVLESLYAACFETDLLVKTGLIGDRLALETLLVTASELAKTGVRPTA